MTFTEILAESRRLVKANSSSFLTADIVASANRALERIAVLIRNSEGRWQWDDSNQTDLPNATTALVANQQDYTLSTTHLKIERVEVKGENNTWHKLVPIDQADLFDSSLTEFLNTAGTPLYYDKVGNSLFLYPKPSYAQSASLKVYFQRGVSYFLTTDTSKEPGINTLFHDLIPLWCAHDYARINLSKAKKDGIRQEIADMEDALIGFYSVRDKDERNPRITSRGARIRFN